MLGFVCFLIFVQDYMSGKLKVDQYVTGTFQLVRELVLLGESFFSNLFG